MDDEYFEDTISIVNYTDSQKSFATNNAHSPDRTDTSSGKSRGTYVIAVDSDLSVGVGAGAQRGDGSDRAAHRKHDGVCERAQCPERRAEGDGSDNSDDRRRSPPCAAVAPLPDARQATSAKPPQIKIHNSTLTEGVAKASELHVHQTTDSLYTCSLVSQEIFTQTSKTIFELAQINHLKCTNIHTNAIETQTSRVSIIENKTTEYRIEVTGERPRCGRQELLPGRDRAGAGASPDDPDRDRGSSETLKVIEEESKSLCEYTERLELSDETSENAYSFKYDTDFTDSLEDDHTRLSGQDNISDTSVPKSVDRDVEELYTKLEESFDLRSFDRPEALDVPRHGDRALSPLTEETGISKPKQDSNKIFGIRTELKGEKNEDRDQWTLPPIRRPLSPRSPRWSKFGSPSAGAGERAEPSSSGESARDPTTTGRAEPPRLPAIAGREERRARSRGRAGAGAARGTLTPQETISISRKIQQLKLPVARKWTNRNYTTSDSRSSSPGECAGASAEVAARGADALAAAVLARLRQAASAGAGAPSEAHALAGGAGAARFDGSDSCGAKWAEAVEVLEEVPGLFRGFWGAVPEHRIADLLRLVTAQVESPRTRVASAACAALAAVLQNSSYTKKPEWMEAVSALVVKTGSCVAPVRRAANLALDAVVAAAPPAAAVAALCHAGLDHKSPAVRSATARLLVVCAALARGGRGLLRARPPSAAAARRAALRALSRLLQDRCQDTRRYAERLYVMLRPLEGFAAFFLADVDARTACRQMKKYDQLLAPGSSPPATPH